MMIVTVFPVVGFPLQTAEMKISKIAHTEHKSLTPTIAQTQSYDTSMGEKTDFFRPEMTVGDMSDIVISMIEQVDGSIYLSYLENLTHLGPRPTGSSTCVAAAAYIYNQFESMGLAVRYHNWTWGGYSSANVEATIKGTNESSDEIYIICAHYDTVSAGPGADDDTSGTVAVIMAAFIMSQHQYKFNHTIKFVTFSGEEQGLLGSRVYAADAATKGWNIVGVLNADMISYAVTTRDGNNLIVYENTASEKLYTYTLNINTEYADYIHLTLHHGGSTWGSDHNSFWDEGYDALFYFEYTETPYYHSPSDTIAHINMTYAVKNIRLILATLAELSEAGFLNNPPAKPVLTGPTSGVINQAYNLSVVTTDPEGQDVYYFIEWGDSQVDEWVGPYNSGATAEITHQWNKKGVYTIRVKAKDISSIESDWGTMNVVMPIEYTFFFHAFLQHLLGVFPHMSPILRYLKGY
jgi:hypothetical protein